MSASKNKQIKAKWLFSNKSVKNHQNEPQLSASQQYGVVPQATLENNLNTRFMAAIKSLENFKLVEKNDFVISLRSFQGGIEHSNHRGIISPAYTVMTPCELIYPNFFKYALKEVDFIVRLNSVTIGIRDGKTITYDDFGQLILDIPPINQQIEISQFLDEKTQLIDKIIRLLEASLVKLEEVRSALITQYVTKGLNPDVPLRDSGIENINQIPMHWKIIKIKQICQIFGRIGFKGYSIQDLVKPGEGAISLSPRNIVNGTMNYSDCTYLSWEKYYQSPEIMLEYQDVLMVKTGSTFGRVGFVDNLIEKTTINPQLIVFKNLQIDRKYFYYLLTSRYIKSLTDVCNTGSTIPTMSQEKISNFTIPVPPRDEIKQILEYIDNSSTIINESIILIESKINRLEEYRNALISAAVTGKIDVRSL